VVLELTGRGETVSAALSQVRQGRVDGVVLSLGELRTSDRRGIGEILQHVPVVLLQQDDVVPGAHTVSAKDEHGAAEAVALVVAAGHRRIAWLGADPQWPGPRRRLEGIRASCRAAGLELVEWEAAAYTVEEARAAVAGRLVGADGPTALLAVNDLVALGVIHQAESEGVRVPEDLAVIGFNDFEFAQWVRPAITTVRLPAARMGARAAELVIDGATEEGRRSAESVRFEVELVPRGTTRPTGSEQ
jgi:DNA-binding LacI/PurR family transcriptional regulator